mgnify:CR=1 FL=1
MNLLEEESLANGLQLAYYDNSRVLAGDRWLVELNCRALCPLPENPAAAFEEPDPELHAAVLARLGEELRFEIKRTRHFVDREEKEEVLAQLLAGVKGHMLAYFAKPGFPARLLVDTCERLKTQCRLDRERELSAVEDTEDDGPADFSAIFK